MFSCVSPSCLVRRWVVVGFHMATDEKVMHCLHRALSYMQHKIQHVSLLVTV